LEQHLVHHPHHLELVSLAENKVICHELAQNESAFAAMPKATPLTIAHRHKTITLSNQTPNSVITPTHTSETRATTVGGAEGVIAEECGEAVEAEQPVTGTHQELTLIGTSMTSTLTEDVCGEEETHKLAWPAEILPLNVDATETIATFDMNRELSLSWPTTHMKRWQGR
jgi:hypothetical protein